MVKTIYLLSMSMKPLTKFQDGFTLKSGLMTFASWDWRTTGDPPPPLRLQPLPCIHIQRAGKDIRFATDLPAVRLRPKRIDLTAVEGPIEHRKAKRGKHASQSTPVYILIEILILNFSTNVVLPITKISHVAQTYCKTSPHSMETSSWTSLDSKFSSLSLTFLPLQSCSDPHFFRFYSDLAPK